MRAFKILKLPINTLAIFLLFLFIFSNSVDARILSKLMNNLRTKNNPVKIQLLREPPEQPKEGPGGKDYSYNRVSSTIFNKGTNLEYWIFEPNSPTPKNILPVIVFNHGWIGMNPKFYDAWINHIVRKGNIVIFPRYQKSLNTPQSEFTPNAIKAVKLAISKLQSSSHTKPNLNNFAILGHSIGGIVSANMAALASENGIPQPKAIMCVAPEATWFKSKLEDLSKIPKGTLLITAIGNQENLPSIDTKKIIAETVNIPNEDKNLVMLFSDNYGNPELIADHLAPCGLSPEMGSDKASSWKTTNALDYYGFWKLFDGLYNAAFFNINRDYALGNTPKQRFMGKWSDGNPVRELDVAGN